jgi:hypothetical protein
VEPYRLPLTFLLNHKASLYDTTQEDVSEVTYKITAFPLSAKEPLPRPPKESVYVNSLFNPTPIPLDGPIEVHLYRELSNPHSRAKKQARWQEQKRRTATQLQEYIKAEISNLKGRTMAEARAEATWKWRRDTEDERKAEKKRRRSNRMTEAKMIRKKARKERKERKKRERLTEMVLRDAPNQFIPSSPSSSSSI